MKDVTILGDVVLTFDSQLPGIFSSSLTPTFDVIIVGDGLSSNESTFKISMDSPGRLRRGRVSSALAPP